MSNDSRRDSAATMLVKPKESNESSKASITESGDRRALALTGTSYTESGDRRALAISRHRVRGPPCPIVSQSPGTAVPWPKRGGTECGDRRALAITRSKAERSGITNAEHSGIHEEHSAVCPGPKESRTVLDTLAIMRLEIHPLD
ncbi:hypothetical protein THAOC_13975 [Thalassiosira oceanica]|uniref:Uncharacterized protein n=1 Tax=Thalassiosira oceanica TaxID=159749 RepID=K0SW70_THAOC|nr:hypothetical protein THAOC_13975 [Thalassiosira oceanica]|eukprot:EJK65196.1 hypothetical protein THAOC_13975 [Thalassiosira oceanica]